MEWAKSHPVVIHFLGTKKRWQWGCKHPDRGLYWKYLKKTPSKRYYHENPSTLNILSSIAPKSMIDFFAKKVNLYS